MTTATPRTDRTNTLAGIVPAAATGVWHDIETVNRRLARIAQINRFTIRPDDFSQADGELTPTLKIKRNVITARYAQCISDVNSRSEP